jgi:spore coat polysaccharide biosynthesis protein SpsF
VSGAAIVLQARMGSRRLPGKALAILEGRTVLAHCLERLRARSGLPVVLATTTRAEDDCLVEEGTRLGATVVRGSDEDVLGRFVLVTSQLGLTEVIRATADNPAVDLDAPRRVLELRRRTGSDHVIEYGLPYGTAVEAMSAQSLCRCAERATATYDREHVTSFLRRESGFVIVPAIAPSEVYRPELRLTIDTPEDLFWVRSVFADASRTGGPAAPIPLTALIAAADRLALAAGSV